MKPVLDIITVTKDDFDGVAATIRSTSLLRKFDGVRQIVVDSSNESIASNLRRIATGESGTTVLRQPPSGIASAFNHAVANSSAPWLWFLNGGDIVHPDLDPRFLLRILGCSRADIIVFQLELMQSKKVLNRPPFWTLWPPVSGNWIPHPATLVRRSLLDQHGAFDEGYRIAMDLDLWIRLFSSDAAVDLLSIPLAQYDENGISASDQVGTRKEASRVMRSHMRTLIRQLRIQGGRLMRAIANL